MPYQPFDIVMLQPKFGAKIYAIVEVAPNCTEQPYLAVRLDKGPLTRRYRLDEENILARIGTLDPVALQLNPAQIESAPSLDWETGQHFARYMGAGRGHGAGP